MTRIAIIGTAGRDKNRPMTLGLWNWMVEHAMGAFPAGHHLVSGGAAWADHLAVELFLKGHSVGLTLHLPAPLDELGFQGPSNSSASAANYYHDRFSHSIGRSTIWDLHLAIQMGAQFTNQPSSVGYAAMFARNLRVARDAEALLAYTFGPGDVPADGGTLDTWNKCTAETKLHVPLPIIR